MTTQKQPSSAELDSMAEFMNEIGVEIAATIGDDLDGTFLYVEAGEGWVAPSLFRDEGAIVRNYLPAHELDMLLMDEWHRLAPERRWSALQYEIHGTRFDVKLIYPDEFESWGEPEGFDHLTDILKKRYGAKPIIDTGWPKRPKAD